MKRQKLSTRFLTMALLVVSLCLVGCGEKGEDKTSPVTPPTPSTPDTPTPQSGTQTIPVSGGTVAIGDITIAFPSGTFAGDSQVSVTEVKSGQILGEDEESKFYQVTLPVDFRKEFTVSIKSDKKDENTYMVFHAPVVATHDITGTGTYADIYMSATYANGAYTAKIDAADNVGVNERTNITFGLAKAYASVTSTETRAGGTRSEEDGTIKWKLCDGWHLNVTSGSSNAKLEKDVNDAMADAVKAIKDLGFKVKHDRYLLLTLTTSLADGTYGEHDQSRIHDRFSVIRLNRKILGGSNYNLKKLRCTIIHELFHYFQAAYDPSETAWEKCGAKDDCQRKRIMEAGGVWIEKLFDEERMYDCGWWDNFNDALRGYLDEGINSDDIEKAYQSWGYGSAFILDWFELKKGKTQILKMYETWRDKKNNDFEPWLKECEKACEVEFFSKFSDYITTLAEGKLNAGIDWTILNPKAGRQKFTANNFAMDGALEFALMKNSSDFRKSIVYHYGIKICRIWITREQKDLDLKNSILKISHNQKNIQAKVWLTEKNSGAVTYMGTILAGKPMQITDEATLNALSDKRTQSDLVVVVEQISNERQQEAFEINASLEDPEIKTNPASLAFESKGGSKEVTVLTNQPNFKVKANDNWLEVKKEDNVTFKVTASQNTGNARTGSVTVTALNDENKEVGTYEMQVTQDERGKGAYDFTDLKYVTIEVNSKVHYTGVWDGSQNDVFVVTKFPDNFNITPAYLAESPSTKTTVTTVGNGVHIECVCQTEESGEWMGVWNMSRDYQVTLDIDDVVSGKITNISAKCYWYNIHRADASVGGNVEESYNDENLSASNIPLPNKSGEAKGDQWTGTSINCSRSEHRGWTDYKYTTISSDEYSIIVKFHK